MAEPVIVEDWLYTGSAGSSRNVYCLDTPFGTSDQKAEPRALLAIKNRWLGFASTPAITCAGSANGTTGGMDAVDRWTTSADCDANNNWFCFDIGFGFEVLMVVQADQQQLALYFSKAAGFTGGDATTPPTATDQVQWHSGAWCGNTSQKDIVFHTMRTADGVSTRVVVWKDGQPVGLWVIDIPPRGAPPAFTDAHLFVSPSSATLPGSTLTSLLLGSTTIGRVRAGSTTVNASFATYGLGASGSVVVAQTVVSDFGSEYLCTPIGSLGLATPARDHLGTVRDLWAVQDLPADGDHKLAGSVRELVVMGSFLVPWESATPIDVPNGQNTAPTSTAGTARTFREIVPYDSNTPPPADAVSPVINGFVPSSGGSLGADDPLQFDVTDLSGLITASTAVYASFDSGVTWELVHSGTAFGPRYSTGSTRSAITDGFRYILERVGGWPTSAVRIDARAIDTDGNAT